MPNNTNEHVVIAGMNEIKVEIEERPEMGSVFIQLTNHTDFMLARITEAQWQVALDRMGYEKRR